MPRTAIERLASIRKSHSEAVKVNQKHINKFCTALKNNPQYEMEWAKGTFVAAARHRVSQQIVALIDNMPKGKAEGALTPAERITRLYEYIRTETVRRARNVPSSSSAASNMAEAELTAAYAEAVQDLEWSAAAVAVDSEE